MKDHLTPQPSPPSVDHLRTTLRTVVYTVVCIDMKDILKNVERYHFDDEQSKEAYSNEIYALITEGHVIYRKLFKDEMDSRNDFF
ncbi:hypothetical protein TNCT_610241 [Trichonephila clavata]|uniref:Uncharacterized protein n=1 Tax=Trichonephila clavata TaxID=2740835 RepID=A0A8X6JGL5_TRICU|nr:hypothetical protein TNCT_610241 [Trichonephila clavata]